MLNAFLTHVLQVIIVLDVVGLVAYFVLCARRSRGSSAPETAPAPVVGGAGHSSLWSKLTGARRLQTVRSAAGGSTSSLDGALRQLRQVLDSYRNSLA